MKFRALVAFVCGGLAACTPLIGLDHDYSVGSPDSGGQPPSTAGGGSGGLIGSAGAGTTAGAGGTAGTTDPFPKTLPAGKLVYHRYTTYNNSDSQMFVVSLPQGTVSAELGAAFGICDPMAGIFSPDGTQLAVTARPKTGPVCPVGMNRSELEIYLLDLTTLGSSTPQAFRVTNNTVPDEDPQFAPTSNFLLLKHDGHLAKWILGSPQFTLCSTPNTGTYCYKTSGSEESKPVMSSDESIICYYEKSNSSSDVYCFDAAQGAGGADIFAISMPAAAHPNISEARPMISGNWLYYARWFSQSDQVDRVYRKPLGDLKGPETPAQFQNDQNEQAYDYSDPSVVDNDLLLISSDATGAGMHDLFAANFSGSGLQSLDVWVPGLNSKQEELGPSFWRKP